MIHYMQNILCTTMQPLSPPALLPHLKGSSYLSRHPFALVSWSFSIFCGPWCPGHFFFFFSRTFLWGCTLFWFSLILCLNESAWKILFCIMFTLFYNPNPWLNSPWSSRLSRKWNAFALSLFELDFGWLPASSTFLGSFLLPTFHHEQDNRFRLAAGAPLLWSCPPCCPCGCHISTVATSWEPVLTVRAWVSAILATVSRVWGPKQKA